MSKMVQKTKTKANRKIIPLSEKPKKSSRLTLKATAPVSNGLESKRKKPKIASSDKKTPASSASTSRKRRREINSGPESTQTENLSLESTDLPSTSKRVKSVKSKAKQARVKASPLASISGKVFVIGQNDVGQLGFGEDIPQRTRPTQLQLSQSVIDVAAGGMHSVCLTTSGEVITFGCNDEGALGRITDSEYLPQKVDIPERIVQISAGDSHTAALAESGQVYLWGNFRSNNGAMGLTASGHSHTNPIKILNDVKIVMISSGNDHLVCFSDEGIVYSCGCGEAGQLGRITERSCTSVALLEPGIVPIGKSSRQSVLIDSVWTGAYTTFLRAQESGEIFAFGLNNYSQLGFNGKLESQFSGKQIVSFKEKTWLQINGGQHHTLALDSEGLVYAIGRKEYGRLGLGQDCDDKSAPTLIDTLQKEKCVNISSGDFVSFAVTENGNVYSWGMGSNCQLGHGNEDDIHVPKVIEGDLLNSWKVIKASGGGQHTLILACQRENTEKNKKK